MRGAGGLQESPADRGARFRPRGHLSRAAPAVRGGRCANRFVIVRTACAVAGGPAQAALILLDCPLPARTQVER